ncbi:hypothetical protein [Flammeovirga sp. SJP92]|uniref:hypothetical protein n=1 Tax=Flammeovirga sp. SJP92 TaxID=1775430 RepID=UPI000786C178|nr:hypothetical protein [Flammeovirga sp. SJP92]KXX70281.1 hypothetical protein AVL50_11790 [Flammeovirga sp. SJP92]
MGLVFDRLVQEVKKLQNNLNDQQISECFQRIADYLMNYCVLKAGIQNYRIVEIEFYFHHEKHPDPYVHQHENQKTLGRWYVHGAGIDITFGTLDFYGGILIRGIQRKSDKQFISGPLHVIAEIFHFIGGVDVQEVEFGLKEKEMSYETIAQSSRVGLSSNKKGGEGYLKKKYRFVSCIGPKHPFKNKKIVALDLVGEKSVQEVNSLFGYKIMM